MKKEENSRGKGVDVGRSHMECGFTVHGERFVFYCQ